MPLAKRVDSLGEDAVAVVEMEPLEVEKRLRAGSDPMGLIVL